MPNIDEVWRQIHALPHRYIFYTRKEIRYLPKILAENEKILALTSGYLRGSTWLCVCTSQRLLLLNRGMFFGLRQVQMNLDRIQSIDSSFTIFFGTLRFWDGASSISISMVLKSTIHPFVRTVQEAMDRYNEAVRSSLVQVADNWTKGGAQVSLLETTEGGANLRKQLENMRIHGCTPVVAINVFPGDHPADIAAIEEIAAEFGARSAVSTHFADGGAGEGNAGQGDAVVDVVGRAHRHRMCTRVSKCAEVFANVTLDGEDADRGRRARHQPRAQGGMIGRLLQAVAAKPGHGR